MANMSYCRNENTYHDMVDCVQNFHIVASNQRDESYRKRLLSLIIDFVESGEAHEALLVEDNEEE
jgi:hypothetical protein